MKLTRSILGLSFVLALSLVTPTSSPAAEIAEVMKNTMKGESSLYRKVATGKGSQSDADHLVASLKELAGKKPPKGEQAAFDDKVSNLVKAAESVAAKNPGAMEKLQIAGNCKACHSSHKGD